MTKIQISQTMGQIGIRVEKANIEIKNSQPKFNIEHKPAKFHISEKSPKFKLDQSHYLVASGNMTTLFLSSTRFEKARKMTMDAIKRIADEGDILMQIENKGSPISDIAIENTTKEVSLTVAPMPQNDIVWEKGFFELEWSPHEIDIKWEVNEPEITATRHKVEVYMKQWPSIDISVITDSKPLWTRYREKKIGINFDKGV